MDSKKLFEILDKHVEQEALMKDLAIELFMPMLEKFVADTSNPYDDKLIAAIKAFINKK